MTSSLKVGANSGFTVVEVMIVLAVSSLILLGAILVFSGKQTRTEFSQSVNQLQTEIQQTINDTSNGYYPTNNNFSCSQDRATGYPDIAQASNQGQGQNLGCIFLGKVMQFAVSSYTDPNINVYTIVGGQNQFSNGAVSSSSADDLSNSNAIILAAPAGINQYPAPLPPQYTLEYGLQIQCIVVGVLTNANCVPASSLGSIAFAISPSGSATSNSNEIMTNAIALAGTQLGQGGPSTVGVTNINNALANLQNNPSGVINICVNQGSGTSRSGLITLGTNSGHLVVYTSIISTSNNCL